MLGLKKKIFFFELLLLLILFFSLFIINDYYCVYVINMYVCAASDISAEIKLVSCGLYFSIVFLLTENSLYITLTLCSMCFCVFFACSKLLSFVVVFHFTSEKGADARSIFFTTNWKYITNQVGDQIQTNKKRHYECTIIANKKCACRTDITLICNMFGCCKNNELTTKQCEKKLNPFFALHVGFVISSS